MLRGWHGNRYILPHVEAANNGPLRSKETN